MGCILEPPTPSSSPPLGTFSNSPWPQSCIPLQQKLQGTLSATVAAFPFFLHSSSFAQPFALLSSFHLHSQSPSPTAIAKMGVDSFQLPPRSLRFLLILGFTCMLVLPLYKLRDHDAARHYKQYFYDHLTQFLDEDQCHKYYNKNSTTHRQGSEPAAQPPSAQPATIHHTQSNVSSSCPGFPETDGIMLVMKTGGTEAFDKVPTQLLSGLQCLPDFLLFSDLVSSNICTYLDPCHFCFSFSMSRAALPLRYHIRSGSWLPCLSCHHSVGWLKDLD